MKVAQYHASIVGADAIGYSITALHGVLTALGIDSRLYCADGQTHVSDALLPASRLLQRVADDTPDVLILHYSFLDEMVVRLAGLPGRKVFVYHNITPGHFFERPDVPSLGWLAGICDASRQQLASLAHCFDVALGVSEFNSQELRDLGFAPVATLPIFVDVEYFRSDVLDHDFYHAIRAAAATNIAFVGRYVPNKAIEDVITVLGRYRQLFDADIRLHLVGKIWNQEYYASLLTHAARAGVLDLVRTHVGLGQLQLKTLFCAADAFISMSRHEGFMVPIIEAFAAGCPVIARDAGAVAETMGDGGFLQRDVDFDRVAGLIRMLKLDGELRSRVIAGQRQRAFDFRLEAVARAWLDTLARLH